MRAEKWGLAGLLTLALLLRLVPALGTDAQFDEIYTIDRIAASRSFADLFSPRMNSDNNHLLVTISCFFTQSRDAWACRIPSVLLGTAVVALAWVVGRRQGSRREGWIAGALTAVSYPLVFYSAEARGYAAVAFFALLSFHLHAGLARAGPRLARLVWFWAVCILGLLSHFSFILVLVGYGIGEAALFLRRDLRQPRAAILRLAAVYLPVLLFLGALYFLWIRSLQILGGPIYGYPTVAGWFLAEAMNAPLRMTSAATVWCCAAATTAFAAHGVWLLRRDDRGILYGALLVCAPLLVMLTTRPQLVYSRYFIVLLPFVLLAIGHSLGSLLAGGARRKAPAVLFAAAFVLMGAQRSAALTSRGKTHYVDTLRFLLQNPEGKERLTLCAWKQEMTEIIARYFANAIAAAPHTAKLGFAPGQNLWQGEAACDFAVVSRDDLEFNRVDPEKSSVLPLGKRELPLLFSRPSADRLETDWFVYRPVEGTLRGRADRRPADK